MKKEPCVKIKELETMIMRHFAENLLMENPFKDKVKHYAIDVALIMKLKKGHFQTLGFQLAYEAFLNLYAAGKPITLLTVHETIHDKIVDMDILDLFDPHPNTLNLVALIGELLKGAWSRDCVSQLYDVYNEHADWIPWKDLTSLVNVFKNFQAPPNFVPEISEDIGDGLSKVWADKIAIYLSSEKEKPINTGFTGIDYHLNGLSEGKFIVIAALSGCGKTALATNICLNIGKNYNRCLYITNEMDRYEIFDRMMATQSEIKFIEINKKEIKDENQGKLNAAFKIMETLPIRICDNSFGSWEKAEDAIRKFSKGRKGRVVFLDYLQQYHLDKKSQSRVAELTEITARIKCIAMELNLTMIVMSQMNRAIYNRDDKTPVLADLKESGSIEQDADSVIFLQDAGKISTAGKELTRMKVFVEKNRSGTRGDFEMTADLSINKFYSV
jgi:replicative DNA helicase